MKIERRSLSLLQQNIEKKYIKDTLFANTILNMIWSFCAYNLSQIGSSYKEIHNELAFQVLIEAGLLLGFTDDGGMYNLIDNIIPAIKQNEPS